MNCICCGKHTDAFALCPDCFDQSAKSGELLSLFPLDSAKLRKKIPVQAPEINDGMTKPASPLEKNTQSVAKPVLPVAKPAEPEVKPVTPVAAAVTPVTKSVASASVQPKQTAVRRTQNRLSRVLSEFKQKRPANKRKQGDRHWILGIVSWIKFVGSLLGFASMLLTFLVMIGFSGETERFSRSILGLYVQLLCVGCFWFSWSEDAIYENGWRVFSSIGLFITFMIALGLSYMPNILAKPANTITELIHNRPVGGEVYYYDKGILGMYKTTGKGEVHFPAEDENGAYIGIWIIVGDYINGVLSGEGEGTFYNEHGDILMSRTWRDGILVPETVFVLPAEDME